MARQPSSRRFWADSKAGAVPARRAGGSRGPARTTRRRQPFGQRLGPAADRHQPWQRRAGADIRLQGSQPQRRAKRSVTIGGQFVLAEEDAADAGDADRRLHVQAARNGVSRPAFPSAGGGLGGVLESVLGGGQTSGSATSGSGLPGLAAMLDFNGDGNALDDILRIVGKVLR